MGGELGSSSRAIDSSNIGFQLLRKCGWKEGTGLGVAEQGRLEPVQVHVKTNKSGIGIEKTKKRVKHLNGADADVAGNKKGFLQPKKKAKLVTKKIRKMIEEEEKRKERDFKRAFFMEFWPDNA